MCKYWAAVVAGHSNLSLIRGVNGEYSSSVAFAPLPMSEYNRVFPTTFWTFSHVNEPANNSQTH